ncbi:DUF423 domain-containing protein [Microvenator marinus]|jgi:uncharacterized membrane protein YgdD (TMEM256/DUF423 family)|uniref:DUF423 domain-containing protein n=1 Tax=Microvenator marinus TaxID=2600177 RepID=A0A5B8XK19_9DELT|nr:DUF423 domain-containing protein [Microvenator marinus]QED26142.1 DUF423 domain-containing protein [Microvenator marinus]
MKIFLLLGSVFGGLSVAAGAFGAHALKGKLEPRLFEVFETAAQYQMYHALALLAVAWLVGETQSQAATVAGWSFVAGILLFSGSLYTMAFTGIRMLGAITPIGGVAFIVGWICLLLVAINK